MSSSSFDVIINGVRNHDRGVVKSLYDHLRPMIRTYILKNKGKIDEADDVFQETMLIFYKLIQNADFQLDASVYNYIFAIAKNVWRKKIKNNRKIGRTFSSEMTLIDRETIEMDYESMEKMVLVREKLGELNDDCRDLLTAFFSGYTINEMVEMFDLSSKEYARKKKYVCKERLLDLIKKDPRYQELISL